MPSITIVVSDEFNSRINAIVAGLKQQKTEWKLTPAQEKEAKKIAINKGAVAANEYVKSIRPVKERISRMGLIIKFAEIGLALEEASANKKVKAKNSSATKKD